MFQQKNIFNIPAVNFFYNDSDHRKKIFDEEFGIPIGPAAGPHTQLSQNIVCAYLCGGRFFELKTVQTNDSLQISKPCIDVPDEGYNTEWSQELTIDQSFDEYLKAWFALHLLQMVFKFSPADQKDFIFNMSIGYDLEGIKSEKVDKFIFKMKDATNTVQFEVYQNYLIKEIKDGFLSRLLTDEFKFSHERKEKILYFIQNISPLISNSVTLSTMHGCPGNEIKLIARYLLEEKQLHTFIKLNPTLTGFKFVRSVLDRTGFRHVEIKESSFTNDLQFDDAVQLINELNEFSVSCGKHFGLKLSNTLPVQNRDGILSGNEKYLSGRVLFPLTISLAHQLAAKLKNEIKISFSGGAYIHNTKEILECGLYPVTIVTELLKPGGYLRLYQIAESIRDLNIPGVIDVNKLSEISSESLLNEKYSKSYRDISSIKIKKNLPMFDCYIAPCQEACPIHQNVSEYIYYLKNKNFSGALNSILNQNPLPHITGYICDHKCMEHCTRWDYDFPVLIRDLKLEAAYKGLNSYYSEFFVQKVFNESNPKAAVIGGGPSGLAFAFFLLKNGLEVTIFEKEHDAGGIVRNVIPGFRLPQSAINNDIDLIKRLGAKFVFNWKEDKPIEKLKSDGFKYIYVAIGAGKSKTLDLEFSDKPVISAVDFLWNLHHGIDTSLGKRVAVIGGGNSAMDGARAALKQHGVNDVCIIYRRTKEFMPADKEELISALNDGVDFKELLLPLSFQNGILKCQKMMLDKIEIDGRRNVIPVKDSFEEIEVDSVLSAIGEEVDIEFLSRNNFPFDDQGNLIVNKATNESGITNIFIGGDALNGPSTVVEAIADARKAANEILSREFPEKKQLPEINYFGTQTENEDKLITKGKILEPSQLNPELESQRCLHCDILCNKCVDVCPNRANIPIQISNGFKDKFQILHIDTLCNECGNCETFCPYKGAPYKDKITLFDSANNFLNSSNNGFYYIEKSEVQENEMLIRFSGRQFKAVFNWKRNRIETDVIGLPGFSSFAEVISEVIKNYIYLFNNHPENQ
ncbi:MAG: putative selenate reductase subunit YgfK [Ignavibacteriaceae bacterium]|nr:putative selenate reductase subunit YgfK [Ignavibacteriaceae bacterium]